MTAESRARFAASPTCKTLASRSPSTLSTFHAAGPSATTSSASSSALSGSPRSKAAREQRRAQPFVGDIQPSGAFAGGDHQPQGRLRAFLVTRPRARSIEAGQVAGAIIGVEIELHASFITSIALARACRFSAVGRGGLDKTLVAAAHQAKAFGRRSRHLDQRFKLGDGLDVVAGLSGCECTIFLDFGFVREPLSEGRCTNSSTTFQSAGVIDAVAQQQQQCECNRVGRGRSSLARDQLLR